MAATMPVTTLDLSTPQMQSGEIGLQSSSRALNTKSPRLNDFRKSRSVRHCHHDHGATQALNAESSGKLTTAHRDWLQIVALMSIY